MARRSRALPVARLRRLLLVALVALTAALVALFYFGRAGQEQAAPRPATADLEEPDEAGITLRGEGFDHTQTQGDRAVFRLRGASYRVDRQDRVYLDGVELTVYGEEGRQYDVASRQATYDRRHQNAWLAGAVTVRGSDGLVLMSEEFTVGDGGQRVVSGNPVTFAYGGGYEGRAERLEAHFRRRLYVLAGGVEIRRRGSGTDPGAGPDLTLTCQRMLFEEDKRLVRAGGKVEVTQGGQRFQAYRMSGYLAPDRDALRFLRALWGVSGELPGAGDQGQTLRVRSRALSMLFDPDTDEPQKLELEGSRADPAVLYSEDPAGVVRSLTARRIVGRFEGGDLHLAEAFREVKVRESAPDRSDEIVRSASARQAEASVGPDGRITGVTLLRDVRLEQPGTEARGERAYLDLDRGRAELFDQPVQVWSERGDLAAPEVRFDEESGLVHATGGVRARLSDEAGRALSGPLGEDGDEPLRVESQESFWRRSPQAFLFRGQVRAWRGNNLLLADQLRGDEDEERLSASGGVRTVWQPAGEPDPAGPVEVRAQTLTYRRAERLLIYEGEVAVRQGQRTLACDELRVLLDQEQKAERMVCTGRARLSEPASGRTVVGERVVHDLGRGMVEVFGQPVVLSDREGRRAEGQYLTYDPATGAVQLRARPPEPEPEGPPAGSGDPGR